MDNILLTFWVSLRICYYFYYFIIFFKDLGIFYIKSY